MGKHVDEQTIKPVAQETSIAIPLNEFKDFKQVFWKKSVYDFHVNSKKVKGKYVILQVRSMRVNEFLDILDGNNISWSHINYKY